MSKILDANAKVFKALSDPIRIAIIKKLHSGEKCACNLSDELLLAQSKLSYHMKILCESGIIKCRYEGKWTHYKISEEGAAYAISSLIDILSVDKDAEATISHCD